MKCIKGFIAQESSFSFIRPGSDVSYEYNQLRLLQ